jgi:hypothetical protein
MSADPERSADAAGDPPKRVDPWSPHSGEGARFFAASTLIHVALLIGLATLSMTVVREIERVDLQIMESDVGLDGSDLPASLEDFAGLLDVARAPRRDAGRARGPHVRNPRAPAMPNVGGLGPTLGRSTRAPLSSSTNLSFGSGRVGGLGGSFGDYVGGLRKIGLDLVLVIDTTESMQFVLDQVKARATALVRSIQAMVPTSRIGIVAYRDRGDEYVTRWTDLSFRTDKVVAFLSQLSAAGGGDYEEAVLEAIETAVDELSWRTRSKRIVILIGGSPPHERDRIELDTLVRRFKDDGGNLSTIDVTDALHLRFSKWMWQSEHGGKPFELRSKPAHLVEVSKAYRELSAAGGGELIELEDDRRLIRDVLVLTFGKRWEIAMAKYLPRIEE